MPKQYAPDGKKLSMRDFMAKASLHPVMIFIILFCRLNGSLSENDYIFLFCIGMAVFGILTLLLKKGRGGHAGAYICWQAVFLCFYALSMLWAVNAGITRVNLIATIGRTILMFYIVIYMNDKEKIFRVIKLFIAAAFLNSIYLLLTYGVTAISRLDGEGGAMATGWNLNAIGLMMSLAAFFIVFLFSAKKISRLKWMYIFIFVFSVFIVVVTGSRKAILMLACYLAIYYFLTRKNKMGALLIIIISCVVIYQILMSVPVVYELVGSRVESFISGYFGSGAYSASDRTRVYMMDVGGELIRQKPWFGHGMANFKVLYPSGQYSHNNYIELLVGMGVFGTVIYYFGYAKLLWTSIRNTDAIFSKCIITLVVTLLVTEFGLVSYLLITGQLAIGIAFAMLSQVQKDKGLRK